MEFLLRQLEETLNQAADLYGDILSVGQAKQEAIVHADIDGLEQALQAESELLEAAGRLEAQRLRIHQTAARQMGIRPEALTMGKLIQSWAFQDTSGLETAYARLKGILKEVRKITDANAILADTSLKLLNEIRGAVFQTSREETFYGHQGAVQHHATERALVDIAG